MRHSLFLLPLVFAAGCSCQDTTFVPLEWDDLADDYGKWLSMAVAPDGDPVMAYYDVTMGGVGFAVGDVRSDGSVRWRHEQVDGFADSTGLDAGDVGQWCSLAMAPDGTAWVAYHANGNLKVAHRVDGVWTPELAKAGSGLTPMAGQWTSIAVDSDGHPVVAHHDAGNGTLHVARHDGTAWADEEVASGQPYDGVDAEGAAVHRDASVGMYANLVIHDGTEFITFYDAAQQDLRMLEGFPGAYTASTVHHVDGGNVGQWSSLWTDGSKVQIAFEDRKNGDLLFAKREGAGNFEVEVAYDGEFAGSDTEIFVRDGQPAIAFFDGRTNDMKLARFATEGGWSTERIGGGDGAVGFFNEVITLGERQFAASYDYTNKTLYWRPLE